MDIKRSAARGIAVLAVALGAGHLVQTMANKKPTQTAEQPAAIPRNIETVAAGPDLKSQPPAPPEKLAPLPPVATEPPQKATPPAPATPLPPAPATEVTEACPVTLDLIADPSAMIGLTLLAPCHPNERVVIQHAGLAVTAQTTAGGALFSGLPALETTAKVEVHFIDGTDVAAQIAIPDLAGLRRFAVQWAGDDAFQIQGFEGGADYGDTGNVSAANPHRPQPGLPASGGFLTLLGDGTTSTPLLAQVYTYPADPKLTADVVVEAAVTDKTCGRELLGEALLSNGGKVVTSDLTVAMPDCSGIGDYLVLKNLVPDMSIATAD